MRLLSTLEWKIVDFLNEDELPEYAILSHRWGRDEITFQQFNLGRDSLDPGGEGLNKIKRFREHAQQQGYSWVWCDTCCIDKTSSAELSEAINSMWRWYQNATECLVYLSDVPAISAPLEEDRLRADDSTGSKSGSRILPAGERRLSKHDFRLLKRSAWFTRGWTLQELLAPGQITFLDAQWHSFGTKHERCEDLARITGIDVAFLDGGIPISRASIAARMSWVARRQTTRREDIAYCLLGLFSVSMPLLYGEGHKAFMRLQLEILRKSNDESIFAWWDDQNSSGLLAVSPRAFIDSGDIVGIRNFNGGRNQYSMTNQGLELRVPMERRNGALRNLWDFHRVFNGSESRSVKFEAHAKVPRLTVLPSHEVKVLHLACSIGRTLRRGADDTPTRTVYLTLQRYGSTWQRIKCGEFYYTENSPYLHPSKYEIYHVWQQGL